MTLDRNKFKPTKISALKEKDSELYAAAYDNDYDHNRIPRLNINKAGSYKLRIYPAHPEIDNALSIEPKLVNWLPAMKAKYVDGKPVKDDRGEVVLEKGNKPVFNSKVHGGAKKDLVETWIKLAEKDAADRFENEDKRNVFLSPIKGSYTGQKHPGIMAKPTWVGYADLIKEGDVKVFHEIEIGKAIKNQLNKISAIESSEDPLGTDACYTDIDSARAVKVIVDPEASVQDYYSVALDGTKMQVMINGKQKSIPKEYPLSDEDLEKLLSAPPLTNYRTNFTNRDLQLQLQGLKMFEQDNPQFKYIETDEFKETFAYLDEFFPAKEETKVEVKNESSNEDDTSDKFDTMTKEELKLWNKANKTGIVILPSMSEDDIRTTLRMFENGDFNEDDAEEDITITSEDKDQEQENEPEEITPVIKSTNGNSTQSRIEALRQKTNRVTA